LKFTDFAEDYINKTFRAASEGSYKRKKSFLKKLMGKYGKVNFISLGPSGYDAGSACLGVEYTNADVLIFDVWPLQVVSDLNDSEAIKPIEASIFYKCKSSDQHFGFRSNKVAGFNDISDPVYKQLIRKFGED